MHIAILIPVKKIFLITTAIIVIKITIPIIKERIYGIPIFSIIIKKRSDA